MNDCGCKQKPIDYEKRDAIKKLAIAEQKRTGEIIVFFRCSDYDFTTLQNFDKNGKTEIEYFV